MGGYFRKYRLAVDRVEPDMWILVSGMGVIVLVLVTVLILVEVEQRDARCLHQLHRHRVGGKAQYGVAEPGGQTLTDPEHDVRVRKLCRLGRAHGVAVWRGTRRQDRLWRADALHDAGRKRLNRRNIRRNLGRRRHGRQSGERYEGGESRKVEYAAFHAGISYRTNFRSIVI